MLSRAKYFIHQKSGGGGWCWCWFWCWCKSLKTDLFSLKFLGLMELAIGTGSSQQLLRSMSICECTCSHVPTFHEVRLSSHCELLSKSIILLPEGVPNIETESRKVPPARIEIPIISETHQPVDFRGSTFIIGIGIQQD